jgi:hypothetical protein
MTDRPEELNPGAEAGSAGGDDTAAFQRFYLEPSSPATAHGTLYKLLIGWWRDRPGPSA